MAGACPLCSMVLPGDFRSNKNLIAVKAGNGSIVYVFKNAFTNWLQKIGVGEKLLTQIRHTRPGEVFEGIEKLVEQAITKIKEVAAQTAERTKKAVEDVIVEVRSLLERLIKILSLNVSLTST